MLIQPSKSSSVKAWTFVLPVPLTPDAMLPLASNRSVPVVEAGGTKQ